MKTNYKISMYYDDYLKNHEEIVAYDLKSEGNSIIFDTTKETIDYLNLNNINYIIEKNLINNLKNILRFKSVLILSIILLLFAVYMNSYRVNKITFNIDTPINTYIQEEIESTYKRMLVFDLTTISLQELSKDLRSKYSCYEWISVTKDFDEIKVDIIKTGFTNKEKEVLYGNIIATKDGTVETFLAHSGKVLVGKNDYVKKGDVLIQGKYENSFVSPKGYVLAHTYTEEVYKVDKVINNKELTGEHDTFFGMNLFNYQFDFQKNSIYNTFDENRTILLNIPFLFNIYKVEQLEKNDIIYINNKETAVNYGYSLVENNFINSRVLDEEKLEVSKMLSITEHNDYFEITYLVKKLESIGMFKED